MGIDSRELRIGNWVAVGNNQSVVTEIMYGKIHLMGNAVLNRPDQINPIPLTPDILVACGFEIIQEGSMSHPQIFRITYQPMLVENNFDIQYRGSDEWYWNEGNTIVHLKYLHQLQNLYFALTGKEIEYNPK